MLSCIRAPPDVEKMMSGSLFSWACSIARVIFSPTTDPMLPAKKSKLMKATTTGKPPIVPCPVTTASVKSGVLLLLLPALPA